MPAGKHAVYFRSVPGRYYGVQRARSLGGTWELQGTRIASTTQTRFHSALRVNSLNAC